MKFRTTRIAVAITLCLFSFGDISDAFKIVDMTMKQTYTKLLTPTM